MDKVEGRQKNPNKWGNFNLSLKLRGNRLTAFHSNDRSTKTTSFHLYAVSLSGNIIGQAVHTRVSLMKQYNLVPVKGR